MKLLVLILALISLTQATNITEDAEEKLGGFDLLPKIAPLLELMKPILNDQLNPLDRHISIDDENLDIKLDVDIKGTLDGLLNLTPIKFLISIIFRYDIIFELPKLELVISNYDLKGVLGLTKIYGNGEIHIALNDIKFTAKGQLNRKTIDSKKYVLVKTIVPQLTIGSVDFKITGYLNDAERSKMISKIINNIAPTVMNQYEGLVNKEIEKLVLKYTNGLLIPMPI